MTEVKKQLDQNKRRFTLWHVLAFAFGGISFFLAGSCCGSWRAKSASEDELEKRLQDGGRVKVLVYRIISYAKDHNGQFPSDLATLVEVAELSPGRVFTSPGSLTPAPNSAEDVRNGKCDYYYFGKGMKLNQSVGLGMPILATKPGIRRGEFISVGYVVGDDVHVHALLNVPKIVRKLIEQREASSGKMKGDKENSSDGGTGETDREKNSPADAGQ